MQALHLVSLLLIGAAWLVTWRSGCHLARSCGVDDRPSILALGSTLPAAGLIFCVHLIALAALFSGAGLVTPELLLEVGQDGRVQDHRPSAAVVRDAPTPHRARKYPFFQSIQNPRVGGVGPAE